MKPFAPVEEVSKKGTKFTIRQAEFSELPRIKESVEKHLKKTSESQHRYIGKIFLRNLSQLAMGQGEKNSFILIAENPKNGKILGIADGHIPVAEYGKSDCTLSFQEGDGIGSALFEHKLNHFFSDMDAKKVLFSVARANDRANGILHRFGLKGKMVVPGIYTVTKEDWNVLRNSERNVESGQHGTIPFHQNRLSSYLHNLRRWLFNRKP